MDSLHREGQTDIIIDYLTEVQVGVRFGKTDYLALVLIGQAFFRSLGAELYTERETCLHRQLQLFGASVADHGHGTVNVAVDAYEMARLLDPGDDIKTSVQNL